MFLLNKEHLFTSGKSCDNAQYKQGSCELISHKKDALCFDDSWIIAMMTFNKGSINNMTHLLRSMHKQVSASSQQSRHRAEITAHNGSETSVQIMHRWYFVSRFLLPSKSQMTTLTLGLIARTFADWQRFSPHPLRNVVLDTRSLSVTGCLTLAVDTFTGNWTQSWVNSTVRIC